MLTGETTSGRHSVMMFLHGGETPTLTDTTYVALPFNMPRDTAARRTTSVPSSRETFQPANGESGGEGGALERAWSPGKTHPH
jgi:hypothetical protein